jgi:hypothetical protein
MPIFRYFAVVGAGLLTLMFAADTYLPHSAPKAERNPIDKSTIRIASQARLPPSIIFGAIVHQ